MNNILPRFFLPALAACTLISVAQAASSPRQHILLDADWRFEQVKPMPLVNPVAVSSWRWRVGTLAEAGAMTAAGLDTTGGDWKDAASSQDVFGGKNGFAWFRTVLPELSATAAQSRVLRFDGVDDNATVYLNGQKLLHHEGWNDKFDVPLNAAWNTAGPNVVSVLVENTNGGGGITAR